MTIITDETIAAIKAGLAGVTPGPWLAAGSDTAVECWAVLADRGLLGCGQIAILPPEFSARQANAAHIARLDPDTVAALIERLERAEARVKALEEVLKPFAEHEYLEDPDTPDRCSVMCNLGDMRRARAALEGKP